MTPQQALELAQVRVDSFKEQSKEWMTSPPLSSQAIAHIAIDTEIAGYEDWRPIPNIIGYEASNMGNIRSLFNNSKIKRDKEFYLKKVDDGHGYLIVNLKINGKFKTQRVHKIIALCFIGVNPNKDLYVVDHKDNNKLNNEAENLQYITKRHNSTKDRVNKTGLNGVCKNASNRYFSRIFVNGVRIRLGTFATKEEASQAYINKLNSLNA